MILTLLLKNGVSVSKFEVGDDVEVLDLWQVIPSFRGLQGTIKETSAIVTSNGSLRHKVYFPSIKLVTTLPEDYLKKITKQAEISFCLCGAKHTSFPNFHSDYCPEYKERK